MTLLPLALLLSSVNAAELPGDALDRFAVMISSHIDRQDTPRPVFHGCVDWHSAAHGHWALLRIARAAKTHQAEAEKADATMTPEGMEAERLFLRENPNFEMPYGRAWFLRLAVEHSLWSRENKKPEPERLAPMADEVAASLLDFFAKYPPTPFSAEYENSSWALAQLADYFRHRANVEGLARVRKLSERFLTAGVMGFDADFSSPEFFSLYGNWVYALLKTQPPEKVRAFLKKRPIQDEDIKPVTELMPYPHEPAKEFRVQAHHLGVNWSRAWALKELSRSSAVPEKDRPRFQRAYEAHVAEGLKEFKQYGQDYWSYGHWVPQFAVYALTD